ncbi:hypothetical protein J522_0836 [Acinetobacter baumannii 146457]|nr:hypothetical protein J522_0836 [Acinetobacter baumannii 146457]
MLFYLKILSEINLLLIEKMTVNKNISAKNKTRFSKDDLYETQSNFNRHL